MSLPTTSLRRVLLAAAALALFATGLYAQSTEEPQAPPPNPPTSEAQAFQKAMTSVNQVLAAVQVVASMDPVVSEDLAERSRLAQEARRKSVEKMMIIITTGASAGAAIGAASSKTPKGALIGAAVGGVAGLIYQQVMQAQAQKAAESY